MENNWKGTGGVWYIQGKRYPSIESFAKGDVSIRNHPSIATMNSTFRSEEETLANAELMVEAGNVRQQIPFGLTELLKERNELLELVKHLCTLKHIKDLDGKTPYYTEEMPKAWEKAKQLINFDKDGK